MLTKDEVTQFLHRNIGSNDYEKKFTTYENWDKRNGNKYSSTITDYELPEDNILKIFFNSSREIERHEKHLMKEQTCAFEIKKMDMFGSMLEFGIFLKCEYSTIGENFFELKITSFSQIK